MYQYDWEKTFKKKALSFGHCPDYPSPTPARNLGTFFTTLHFLQGIKLEDKEGAARRERRLQVCFQISFHAMLCFWSLVFSPCGKAPSIYQKSHKLWWTTQLILNDCLLSMEPGFCNLNNGEKDTSADCRPRIALRCFPSIKMEPDIPFLLWAIVLPIID